MGLDNGRLREIVAKAALLTGNEREAFLQRACAGDGELLTEARELLEFASADDGFLRPAEPGAALALLESMALPRPGDDVGGFRVLRVLASGGMGVVLEARQENPSRVVALKMIRRGFADDEARRRFQREIEVLARLRHPGIAQVYASGVLDAGTAAETPWYAMELVEGARAVATFVREQALTTRERVQLFQRVCDAVHHGHQRGVIHRDLKSENVLVDAGGHVKVIDFGVARALEGEAEAGSLATRHGNVLGTPTSMSPEQWTGDPDAVDTRSDVWALGVLLYRLLTGHVPFPVEGRSIAAVARAVAESDPVPPRTHDPKIAPDLERVVLKALEKDPRRRYSSAAALRDDLDAWLAGGAVSARPPSLAYQVTVLTRRYRAAAIAAAAVVVVSLAAALVSVRFALDARRSEVLARKRFDEVRGIGRSLLFEVHDAIAPLAGSTNARRVVVSNSLEYLDRLFVDASGDAGLLREVGEGYLRLGNLLAAPSGSSLGDGRGGRAALEKALDAAGAWIVADPSDVRARALRARVLSTLGNVEAAEGNLDSGLTRLVQGDEEARALVNANPDVRELRRMEGALRSMRANGHLRAGDASRAMNCYREAAGIARGLCTEDPKDPVSARDLAVVLVRIGNLELEAGRAREAEEILTEALDLNERRVAADGASREARDDLSTSLERLGDAARARGEFVKATDLLARSVALCRESVATDPGDAGARQSLSIALERLGNAFGSCGNPEKALDCHEEALQLSKQDLERDPTSWSAQQAVSIGETYVGDCLRKLGRRDEAAESLARAASIAEAMLRSRPRSIEARRAVLNAYLIRGETLLDAGRPEETLTQLERIQPVAMDALTSDPRHAWTQRLRLVTLGMALLACSAIGADASLSAPTRRAHLERALEVATSVEAEVERLRGLDLLQPDDAAALERVREDLEACRALLETLGTSQ